MKKPIRKAGSMGLNRARLTNAKTKVMMAGTSGELGSYMGSSTYNKLRKERDSLSNQIDTIKSSTKSLVRKQVEQKVKNDIAKIGKRVKAKKKQ